MSITLKNKKIIISAGGSGIGWSSAKIFLDKGAIEAINNHKSLLRHNTHHS